MKHINKFIALGLGIALTFAGSGFIKAEFYDVAKLSHDIEINVKERNTITIDYSKKAYFVGKDSGNKYDVLYIPIIWSGTGKIDKGSLKADVTAFDGKTNELIGCRGALYPEGSETPTHIQIKLDDGANFGVKVAININLKYSVDNKEFTLKFHVLKGDQSDDPHESVDMNHPEHYGEKCKIQKSDVIPDHATKILYGESEPEETEEPKVEESEGIDNTESEDNPGDDGSILEDDDSSDSSDIVNDEEASESEELTNNNESKEEQQHPAQVLTETVE